MYGDINRDGVIDNLDSQLALQGGSNLDAEQRIIADVDGNGIVNATDSLRINQLISGTISELPMGKYAAFYQ